MTHYHGEFSRPSSPKPLTVRVRGWQNGELYVGSFTFDSHAEAIEFAKEKHKTYGHEVKVYNPLDELLEEFGEAINRPEHHHHHHYA